MSKFNKICDKQNMLLEYDKNLNIYSLLFTINNKNNININSILDFKIYNILKDLNKEIISDVINITLMDNENIILFIFCHIGKEAGLEQKYMFLNNKLINNNNNIIIDTKSITKDELLHKQLLDQNIIDKISNLKEIKCEFAKLNINNINLNNINIHYIFKIIIDDDLPIYLENMIGLLMKKLFLNFKLFIEK